MTVWTNPCNNELCQQNGHLCLPDRLIILGYCYLQIKGENFVFEQQNSGLDLNNWPNSTEHSPASLHCVLEQEHQS